MLLSTNPLLQERTKYVLENVVSGICLCECTIFSQDDETIQIKPYIVNSFTTFQNFPMQYADINQLNVDLKPEEIVLLVSHTENLFCTIKYIPVSEGNNLPDYSKDIYEKTYRVLISDAKDLMKQYNVNQVMETKHRPKSDSLQGMTLPIWLELFTKELYDLRHKQYTTMLANCTIKDVIHHAANALEIKQIEMVEPTNTKIYKQLPLPPMMGIDSVFDYIQDRYGVYSKGFTYYYTEDNVLYIYPEYETNPPKKETDRIVHIYKIPDDSIPGCYGYHTIDENNDLHILCYSQIKTQNNSEQNVETQGNHTISLRTDTAIDLTHSINGKEGTFTSTNIISCGLPTEKSLSPGATNTKYTTSTNNAYKLASEIYKNNCISIQGVWEKAARRLIKPGNIVQYHYEDQEGYVTLYGIVDNLGYRTTVENRAEGSIFYSTICSFTLRLDPTEKVV